MASVSRRETIFITAGKARCRGVKCNARHPERKPARRTTDAKGDGAVPRETNKKTINEQVYKKAAIQNIEQPFSRFSPARLPY
jgi:hypothetical protein